MELRYQINKGLKPDFLDKISGMIESEGALTVNLWLTSSNSKEIVSNKNLARIFGLIMHKLADGRLIRLLFPYDIAEVKKKLLGVNLEAEKGGGWLWLEMTPLRFPDLIQVIQAVSFTTFFAQVDGEKVLPRKAALLFNRLEQIYFLGIFTLYDESIEIVSMLISADAIIDVARAVGVEESIQVSARESTATDSRE